MKKVKEKKVKADKFNDEKSKKGQGIIKLGTLILTISIVPLFLSIVIVTAVNVFMTKNNMESQVENTLYVAASNLSTHCSGNRITGGTVDSYNEYLDCLKEQGIEQGIILEGGSGTSSIKNVNDYRVREIEFTKDFVADREAIEAGFFAESVSIDGVDYFGYFMPIITDDKLVAVAFAGKEQAVVNGAITGSMLISLVLAVVSVVLFSIIGVFTGRYIMSSVNAVIRRMDALSNGDLRDLFEAKKDKSQIKEMVSLVNEAEYMQDTLSVTIGKVKNVSSELGVNIAEVTLLSDSSAGKAKQITNAMEELSLAAGGMAENVQNINVQMMEIGNCITDISEVVELLHDNSEGLLKTNDEAREDMNVILANSKKSVDAVSDITEQIRETNYSINEIQKAVEIILSISDQTQLLALNASIEAARAGEAGKGFAVVAGEISSLSVQSAEGAEMIKDLAHTIMKKSQTSVELAEGITTLIESEQKSVLETQKKYQELSDNISQSVTKIRDISDKTDNITEYKQKVLDNVQDLSAISEENYASCEEVSANVTEIIADVQNINANCERIHIMSSELEDSVEFFHTK